MVIIPLTQGKSAVIDDADANKISHYCWYAWNSRSEKKGGPLWYAKACIPGRKKLFLHHAICGFKKGMDVDHIDGDGLNNTRSNLRICTHSQNLMNQRISRCNKSGFRGVHYLASTAHEKRRKRWRATIKIENKQIFVGHYATAIEAARAYNAASLKFHGDFGYRNLIPSDS